MVLKPTLWRFKTLPGSWVALLVLLLLGLSFLPMYLQRVENPVDTRSRLPNITLPGLQDGVPPLTDERIRGKPAFIHLFASWSRECRAEHPVLLRLAMQSGLPIYGISYREAPETSRNFLDAFGNPFLRSALDTGGTLPRQLGVDAIPATLLVDASGRILFRHTGELTLETLESRVTPLLSGLSYSDQSLKLREVNAQ